MFASTIPLISKGGMQDMVWMLATGLAERGHSVVVFTPPAPDGLSERWLDGVRLIHSSLPMRWIFRSVREDANELYARMVEAEGPFDLVHTHSAGGYLFQRYNQRRGPNRIPLAMSLYGTAVDEIATLARLLFERNAKHGIRPDAKRVLGILYFYLGLLVTRRTFSEGSDALFVTSRQQKDIAVKHYLFESAKVHVVPNAVRTDQFTPPPKHSSRGRLLAVARLLEQKGVQVIVRALPQIRREAPGATLDIVGDGEYRPCLMRLVEDLGLEECVTFHGAVEFADLPTFYQSCDIFLNPTLRANGYDLTVLQAMACGRPVVVSRIGSIPELVTEATGTLIPPGDERALKQAVIELLTNEERARQLGDAARRRIELDFGLDATLDKTLEVYGHILSRQIDPTELTE
jgi:glycosyltransferase involved in cell wall biosynthesis